MSIPYTIREWSTPHPPTLNLTINKPILVSTSPYKHPTHTTILKEIPYTVSFYLHVSGDPKTTLGFGDPLGGLPGLSTELVTAVTSYSKRMQSRIIRGKGTWGQVQGTLGTSFQESSPSGVMQDTFNSPKTDYGNTGEISCPRSVVRDSVLTGSVWASHTRHGGQVPSTSPNPRLQRDSGGSAEATLYSG